jgi:hypothetical protein
MGVALLLHGDRAGVYPVANFPPEIVPLAREEDISVQPRKLNLVGTQQLLHFPMYWPTAMPDNYTLNSMYLYQEPNQSWADGPILELEYDLSAPGVIPAGTGQIFVREFKPTGDVLQLVQKGAAQSVQIEQDGRPKAIYVDGQWVYRDRELPPQWVYGKRSELIYQQGDVVFWVVGDQRDHIGQTELLKIAESLQVVNFARAVHLGASTGYVTRVVESLPGPFTSDVMIIFPDDSGGDGPYYRYASQPNLMTLERMSN